MSDQRVSGNRGIFTGLKLLMERNRLGELLVSSGFLTEEQLAQALACQKEAGEQLGRVLLRRKLVSRSVLYRTLAQQWTLRSLAAMASFTILFSIAGVKSARATPVKDIPVQMSLAAAANAAFSPMQSYPALFGSAEKLSRDIGPFSKWTGMFARFEAAASSTEGREIINSWKNALAGMEGLPLKTMAQQVNSYINQQPYIIDSRNWGVGDYWATPVEFFTYGGDCEDFAIAKYVSLRALGVPEERLRIAIVHDKKKDIPHAVLIVYTDTEALILDNQTDNVLDSERVTRYRPIFSINRQAWWLHTAPKTTVLASAKSFSE